MGRLCTRPVQATASQAYHRLPTRARAPTTTAPPPACGTVPSRRLCRLPREIQPRRCAAIMLVWPTKRTKSSLLLPKDPAATSDEAGTLTDCGSQSCNRQRLRQVRQAGEGKFVLRMGVSSPLGGWCPLFLFLLLLFTSATRPGGGCLHTLCPPGSIEAALAVSDDGFFRSL